ncbi:hypothetical protein LIER_25669 [Lithospermum erythrorhizon]|uniref:Uncharacterized protein n=1 Tax=Lithospermum erythrorhizon TaxID=34254 RepID=A0AAV3R9B4_LITER
MPSVLCAASCWSGSGRIMTPLVTLWRADLQDDARAEACENEKALELQIQELKEENERLKAAATLAAKEKKEAAAQTLAEIKKHDLL